jgi:hypothetical protein
MCLKPLHRSTICNKDYFNLIKPCDKQVNWGNAKPINIKGIGNVIITFIDTKLKCVLKNLPATWFMALMPLSLSLQVGDLYDLRTCEKLSPYHTHGQLEQGSR